MRNVTSSTLFCSAVCTHVLSEGTNLKNRAQHLLFNLVLAKVLVYQFD